MDRSRFGLHALTVILAWNMATMVEAAEEGEADAPAAVAQPAPAPVAVGVLFHKPLFCFDNNAFPGSSAGWIPPDVLDVKIGFNQQKLGHAAAGIHVANAKKQVCFDIQVFQGINVRNPNPGMTFAGIMLDFPQNNGQWKRAAFDLNNQLPNAVIPLNPPARQSTFPPHDGNAKNQAAWPQILPHMREPKRIWQLNGNNKIPLDPRTTDIGRGVKWNGDDFIFSVVLHDCGPNPRIVIKLDAANTK
jgi:hypothetical protein